MKKLLVTDLDNTLYDWVAFFAQSFKAMLDKTHEITGIPTSKLISDFKKIHQYHGNTEHPFSVIELDCIKEYYGTEDRNILLSKLDDALHAFNSTRKNILSCYEGVFDTLQELNSRGILIVGHTEAPVRNSLYRLEKLGIKKFFKHLYTPRDKFHDELDERTLSWLAEHESTLRLLTKDELKPNPQLLIDICEKEKVSVEEAVYIGDSIVKDISMANDAGVTSVWAEYGKQHSPDYWSLLVSITHWTDEDVQREESLKTALGKSKPAHTAKKFSDILHLFMEK
ncbi:HAD family hydrolase [Alteromonas marina]